jgi:hypothetical protein
MRLTAGSRYGCPVAAPSPEARVDNARLIVAGLAWGAALIHVQAALGHAQESTLYAVLFWLLSAAQFAWGAAVYRWSTPALLWGGAAVSVAVVAFWAMSRTTGIPFGPEPWTPEPVGFVDVLASADSLVLAAVVAVRAAQGRGRALPRLAPALNAVAVGLILLSSLTLAGLSGHVH